ncbi:MAG: hypothetical protein U0790_24730 [Isosphaeraceae bacterium]
MNRQRLDRITGFIRDLKPRVDPSSYRPLILLFALPTSVLLWPLSLDVARALVCSAPLQFRLKAGATPMPP